MQDNSQHIPLLFDLAGHIIFPDTVHIICFSDIFLIQVDIRDRIQSIKTKQDLILPGKFLLKLKARLIFIIVFHQRKGADLIVLPEGIFHVPVP